jgi:hypothetical protein
VRRVEMNQQKGHPVRVRRHGCVRYVTTRTFVDRAHRISQAKRGRNPEVVFIFERDRRDQLRKPEGGP